MFCNQCGQKNNDNAKFCSGCGNKLENQDAQNIQIKPLQPNKKLSLFRRVWLTSLFIISLVMLLGVLPYQIISGDFEFIYISGILLWGAACHYSYTQIFSKKSITEAFNALDEAEPWFIKQDIKVSSIQFSSYNDPYLMKNPESTLIVATAKNNGGDHVGFAIEVKSGYGVLSSLIIEPYGIATHHKKAARIAHQHGKNLIDVLNHMAIEHRINHVK
ncbi:zinc ribbon domain-containing protein [Acinetobacter sp. 251-1]|uniref:zinc-ribbon domain-containing protein n=1 Tax=Acinetobacter sp. 251-1 TaxID=2746720 RepID=UPI0025782CF8|nr:zinc ribbon domain-containing protein [Acinetobacter sp. 251-1]